MTTKTKGKGKKKGSVDQIIPEISEDPYLKSSNKEEEGVLKKITFSSNVGESNIETPPPSSIKSLFTGGIEKNEMAYNLQEWMLIKSFTFSMIAVIVFVILSKFILTLVGDYLPVIALSILTSIALQPTKESIASTLKEGLGVISSDETKNSFIYGSAIRRIFGGLFELSEYKRFSERYKKRKEKLIQFYNSLNWTNDIPTVFVIFCLYFLVSRFGLIALVYIFMVFLTLDLVTRILLDGVRFIINQFNILQKWKSRIQSSETVSKNIDSAVATFVISSFLLLSISCVVIIMLLIFMDAQDILVNLRTFTTSSVGTINEMISTKLGIENAIDENLVRNFLKNYNESIYSYIQNDDLRVLYLSFSETLNNYTSNSTHSLQDFPDFVKGIVDHPSSVPHTLDFQECLDSTKVGLDYQVVHYFKYVYCSFLTYGSKLAIDPYQIIDKLKDGLTIIFRILFGSILAQIFLISKAAVDYLLNFLFFNICVYYLLQSKGSFVEGFTNLLPLDTQTKKEVQEFALKSVKGSFLCSIKLFIYHFILTWISFDALDLPLGFIVSITAAFVSIIQLTSPFIICIPHALYIYFVRENLILALLFIAIYMLISSRVYNDIFETSIDIHPYVTGLSIMMGLYAFNLQGIIYGPLLMCMALIVYRITKRYSSSASQFLKDQRKNFIFNQTK